MSTGINRRQSGRTVRSTANRPSNYYATNQLDEPTESDRQPGFFPAITHFTDAVDALPREVMRHFSLMKEVDANLYAPDEELQKTAKELSKISQPAAPNYDGRELQLTLEEANLLRSLSYQIHIMAPMLEEKISVLVSANQTLTRQLQIMNSSYKHISDEISPEARFGSMSHWAYVAEKEPKKTGHERTRREAAANNAFAGGAMSRLQEIDRREPIISKKSRNQIVDSDFEERTGRKQPPKVRKEKGSEGHGKDNVIQTNGHHPTAHNKRKKPTAAIMERSMSSVYGVSKGQASSPVLGSEGKKRKGVPGPLPNKKRVAPSPRIPASSPLMGTLNIKENGRSNHSRGRHGSQNVPPATSESTRNRSISPHVGAQRNGVSNVMDDTETKIEKESEIQKEIQENGNTENHDTENINDDVKENGETAEADTDVNGAASIVTRTGRVSKAVTPLTSNFPDNVSKNTKTKSKTNGSSHASSESGVERMSTREKKRRDVSALVAEAEAASDNGDDEVADESEAEDDDDEPRYCYCQEVSYGEMIACDNEQCSRQWFHLRCAGLREAPSATAKWYCDDCKVDSKDNVNNNGNGNGNGNGNVTGVGNGSGSGSGSVSANGNGSGNGKGRNRPSSRRE